jgi:uncharacterized repeat protein (TIGR03803 family)
MKMISFVALFGGAIVLPFSCGALTPLYVFTNGIDGSEPSAALTRGTDGNFYGTTFYGGSNHLGLVFKITPSGVLTPLHSFSFGIWPAAGLAQGADGKFYGTTLSGGPALTNGTVFQISSNGAFNSLYSFTNGIDGAAPYAGLAQAGGMFYGTTLAGGSAGEGTVFQITSGGALTPLYSFTNGMDGAQPYGTLLLGGDGNFYGTAFLGGAKGYGTVFKITPAGALTPLYSFTNGVDGANPEGALTQGADGSLYGTTSADDVGGNGSVFKITTNGVFTTLYSFTGGIDGGSPGAGLATGGDGNFYGTTYSGGNGGNGGIFRITPQGALTPLYLFTGGTDGSSPSAALTLGLDGSFYGTTQSGGDAAGDGVVFKLNAYSNPPQLLSITRSAGVINLTWTGQPGKSFQAQYATNLSQTTWSNLGAGVAAPYGVATESDNSPTSSSRFYRVYQAP